VLANAQRCAPHPHTANPAQKGKNTVALIRFGPSWQIKPIWSGLLPNTSIDRTARYTSRLLKKSAEKGLAFVFAG
jgi:hypothetical protein